LIVPDAPPTYLFAEIIRLDLEMIDPFKISSNDDDRAGDLRQFCLNSFRHLSGRSRSLIPPLEFDEFNWRSHSTPLREGLFNGFIGGSFFMWTVLNGGNCFTKNSMVPHRSTYSPHQPLLESLAPAKPLPVNIST
jgi:hypothetical protein